MGYYAVFPLGTSDKEIVDKATERARMFGLEPDGEIAVEEHKVELGHLLIAHVSGTLRRPAPAVDVLRQGPPEREVSTLDRPILWPKRKSTAGMLRSGSSGER